MKDEDCEPGSIEDVLDCVEEAGDGGERVSISDIVGRIGDGAFAPLMLVPALVMVSPATAVFGVASFCGALVALIAAQMVIGRDRLWLPGLILRRTISTATLDTAIAWLAGPGRFVDRLTGKRLSLLVEPPLDRLWAALCVALALIAPMFEVVPMSATVIGAAIALFALAMLARDGLLAILGLVAVGGAVWLLWSVAT